MAMRIVLIGPLGSGKGTQGKRIAKRFEIQYVSSGTLFRNAALQGSSLGKQTESYLKDGFLFPMNWPLSL